MKENKIYAAIAGIDEDILSAAENTGAVTAAFRAAKRRKTAVVLSLCACLLLVAVAAGPIKTWLQGSTPAAEPTRTEPIPASPQATETQTQGPGPFTYSSLTADGHTLKVSRGAGMLDVAAFSEDMLKNADMMIEGTVLDTHIKKYRFVCEAEGKFEYAGQKTTITYTPETIVTTVRIEKIWKGDGRISVGETLTFEDEIVSVEGTFGFHTGATYFLHLKKTDEENLLRMTGGTPDEPLIEGDNHREFRWRNGYPFQPAIEKTAAGDYIVPGTWKTAAQESDADVALNEEDCSGWDPGNSAWYLLGGLKLVPAAQFETRMQSLLAQMGIE